MRKNHQHYLYIILSLYFICTISLTGCANLRNYPAPESIQVGFCVDILGKEEPVFTKPFLEALNRLEKNRLIHLEVQTSLFAKEYEDILHGLAQKNQLIFCGPFFSKTIVQAAKNNPATFFVLLQSIPMNSPDEEINLPNLQVILFKKEDLSNLMGQLCRYYPKKSHFWLVTDLSSDNPIRLLQENMFSKELQKPSRSWSVLEWPFNGKGHEQNAVFLSRDTDQIFCLTEGAYLPSFLDWFDQLPKNRFFLIMPDNAWSQNQKYPILGSVTKSYQVILERIVKQVQKNAWTQGTHYQGTTNHGFELTLSKDLWENSLRKKIISELTLFSVREQ